MTGTMDTFLPLVSMNGTLNTRTDIKWQLLGLWILLLISSGTNREFVYLYIPLGAMSRTRDTKTEL